MTLGVVGCGHVGSRVCHSAAILGMKVLRCDPPLQSAKKPGEWHSFEELIENCDVFTFHVPAISSGPNPTIHMVDAKFLASLKFGTWLLNTSRGEVVDNAALRSWLAAGKGEAVLDVWEKEPSLLPGLLDLVSVATPHIAGYSTDGKANATEQVVRAVAKALQIRELVDWKCTKLPEPDNVYVSLTDLVGQVALGFAVNASYPISKDDHALRSQPANFEDLRNQYWLRREFKSFHVGSVNNVDRETLRALGFLLM